MQRVVGEAQAASEVAVVVFGKDEMEEKREKKTAISVQMIF